MGNFKKFVHFILVITAAAGTALIIDKTLFHEDELSNSWVKNRYKKIYELLTNNENNYHYILGSCGSESSFDTIYLKQKKLNFQNISVRGSSPKEYKQIIQLLIKNNKIDKNTKIIVATQLSELTMKSEKTKERATGNKYRDEKIFESIKLENNDVTSMSYLPIIKNYIRLIFDENWKNYRSIALIKKFNSSNYYDINNNGNVDFESIEQIEDLNKFTLNWQKNNKTYKDFLESVDGRVSLNWSKNTILDFYELFKYFDKLNIKYYWIIMPEIEEIKNSLYEDKLNTFLSFLNSKKIKYIDFSKKLKLLDSHFIDADHLSRSGARIFTEEVYEKIK